jgi:hypothetical protein
MQSSADSRAPGCMLPHAVCLLCSCLGYTCRDPVGPCCSCHGCDTVLLRLLFACQDAKLIKDSNLS